MAPDFREQILSILKTKGPLVPNDLKKTIKGDTMIFGAILSELSSRGLVKITNLKKGGSPFYYVPGQEQKLENLIEFLNPKDQQTMHFLKDQKVVLDKSLELFQRVSLRKIKDFSKELKVNTSEGPLLFWRYYLISETEALTFLRNKHNKPEGQKEKKIEQPKSISNEEQKEIKSLKKEAIENNNEVKSPIKQQVQAKPKPVSKPQQITEQQQLTTTPGLEKSPFYDSVWKFFSEQKIDVIEESLISKDREYEFVVTVPSAIGTIKYYCRARNKKKLNEGDVAPALLKAKTKDLQCLYLTNGEFTKKALVLIKKEYSGLIIKTF